MKFKDVWNAAATVLIGVPTTIAIVAVVAVIAPLIPKSPRTDLPEPETLQGALHNLRTFVQEYFRKELNGALLPLEFWTIPDDDLYYEILKFLPSQLPEHIAYGPNIPEGIRLAYPIFWMEDQELGEGWAGAVENGDTWMAQQLADAYKRMSMPQEARAWERVVQAREASNDERVWQAAFDALAMPEADRIQAQKAFFCSHRELFGPPKLQV